MQRNKKQEKGDFIFSLVYLSGLIFFGQIEKGKVYDKNCWFMGFIFNGLLLLNLYRRRGDLICNYECPLLLCFDMPGLAVSFYLWFLCFSFFPSQELSELLFIG